MSIGLFLRRELISSVRGARAFADRRNAAFLMALVVAGCFGLWDYEGWERASIGGGARFALAIFGLMVAGQMTLLLVLLIPQIGAAIASERERKTLDALLATRLGSGQIVLGTMAAGLIRYANGLAATLPVVALVVFLGGVDRSWIILAAFGLASMAFSAAAVSVAASVVARTGSRAVNLAVGVLAFLASFPGLYLMLRSLFWPSAPAWLTSTFVALLDAGPMGLVFNFAGLIPRPGGPVGAISRLVAWHLGLGCVATAWAIARLRPASRALYDVEGRSTRLKMIRAALRRPPRRPPCGDDPVLWHEIYGGRASGAFRRLIERLFRVASIGTLAVGAWFFAAPAFSELAERGYGPAREAFTLPELNPFARMVVSATYSRFTFGPAPGQARLEFNIIIREATALFVLAYILTVFGAAVEAMKGEQKRDTWLGLITTPLTGREILRAKGLGAIWKAREAGYVMVASWTLGLLAGAVHPLGFLAALALLAASGAFYAAAGNAFALREAEARREGFQVISDVQALPALAAIVVLTAGPIALAWASLLTFEDLEAILRAGPFPALGEAKLKAILGARSTIALGLAGTVALTIGAIRLTRANARGFDGAVGRPIRPDSTMSLESPPLRG